MSGDTRRSGGGFLLELVIVAIKGVVALLGWLLIMNWRRTFPIHVMLGLLALAAVINSSLVSEGWTALLIVTLVAGLIVTLVSTHGAFRENRLFGYVAAGLGSAWVLATRFTDLSGERLFQGLGVLVLAFGILWFLDHRGATSVKLSADMRSWHSDPDRQKRAGVENLQILEHEETHYGWRRRLGWEGNTNSIEGVIKQTRALETEWGELENTLTIERVPAGDGSGRFLSNQVEARCIRLDPLAEPVVWDGEPVRNVTDTVEIGVYADGRPVTFKLWEDGVGGFHTLCAGATRSGKSVLMVLWALLYGPHPYVRELHVDLKGGAAFVPVAALGSWLADNRTAALFLLELLNIECDRRALMIAKMGWPGGVLKPSEKNPIILAFFDEIASLTGDGVPREVRLRALFLFSEIARKGAGIGVLLRIATQEPTKEALGSMQFVTQLAWRAGFRLNQPGRQRYSIPGLSSKGVDPYNIRDTMRGTAYVDSGVASRAMEARMRYIPDWLIKRTVSNFWHHEIQGKPREIPGFDSLVLPPGSTINEERHHEALNVFAQRVKWTPELAAGMDPHDEPSVEDEPVYTPPGAGEGFPRPRPAIEDAPFDYERIAYDDDMEDDVPQLESTVERTCADYVALAADHAISSPEAKHYSILALQAALTEHAGIDGLRRKKIQQYVNRGASWVSAELANLEKAGRAHRVGPQANAYWFPGPDPEAPQDAPRALDPADDDQEV